MNSWPQAVSFLREIAENIILLGKFVKGFAWKTEAENFTAAVFGVLPNGWGAG